MKALYQAEVTAKGGRDGYAESSDGRLRVNLSIPKELGGVPKENSTNPEQLFGAGYAACFESAVRFVAGQQKIKINTSSVTANVSLSANPAGEGFVLGVGLRISLPELPREKAQELIERAHQVCPYSNATRGNLNVQIELI
jgi:lipoyl-dependent peroxiredoxin